MKYLENILAITRATKAKRNYYVGHCPVHDDKHKSFSIAWENDNDLNPLVRCHAGCSQKEVIEWLKRNELWANKTPMVSNKISPLFEKGMAVEKASPWDLYLRKRKVSVDETVEYFGAEEYHDETQKQELCLVFPATNLFGDYIGCQRIFINDLGSKLSLDAPKKYLGDLDGASCKFGDRDDLSELHIAEGIETALSIYNVVKKPTWAMITANNFKIQDLPKSVKELHIWADMDRSSTGQNKAHALAMEVMLRWKIQVYVHLPEEIGTDWNDDINSIQISERYKNDPIYYFKTIKECVSGSIVTDMDIPNTMPRLDAYFTECGEYSDMPRAFIAMPMFTALSTLIANKSKVISPFDGFKYTPSIWSCIIAPPSVRKTTALSKGMSGLKFLINHKEKLSTDYKAAKSEEIRLLQREIKVTKKQLEKSDDPAILEKKLMQLETRWQQLMEPAQFHNYILNNTTIEKLLKDMSESPGAYVIEAGELGSWLAMLDKDYQTHARGIYLELYSGIKDYTIKRMNKESNVKVKYASCNITGTTQPQALFPYLSEMGTDGLFQRFQAIAIQLKSEIAEVKMVEPKIENQNYINDLFLWVDTHLHGDLTLDLNAQVIALEFEKYKRKLVFDLEQMNHPNISSHIGKSDTSFMALSAIFHCVDCYEKRAWSNIIRPEATQIAFEVSKYFIDRIRLCYAASQTKSEIIGELMNDIDSGRHGEVFAHGDLYYGYYRRRIKHNFDIAMEELVRRQFLIKEDDFKGIIYYRPVTKMRNIDGALY